MEFGKELPAGGQEQDGGANSAKKAIALEITAPGNGESQMWDIYPVTLLKVNVSSNKIASIFIQIHYSVHVAQFVRPLLLALYRYSISVFMAFICC